MSSLGGHCNQWTLIEESSIPADDVKEFKLESELTSLSCLFLTSFFLFLNWVSSKIWSLTLYGSIMIKFNTYKYNTPWVLKFYLCISLTVFTLILASSNSQNSRPFKATFCDALQNVSKILKSGMSYECCYRQSSWTRMIWAWKCTPRSLYCKKSRDWLTCVRLHAKIAHAEELWRYNAPDYWRALLYSMKRESQKLHALKK